MVPECLSINGVTADHYDFLTGERIQNQTSNTELPDCIRLQVDAPSHRR